MIKLTIFPFSFLLFVFSSAQAVTVTYSDQASFLSALSGSTQTLDFDSQTAGTTIGSGSSIEGATFTYSIAGGASILIDNAFATTSTDNYLGLDDGSGAFLGGDSFTISFTEAKTAVGLYVISADLIFANDFTLTTDSGLSVNNSGFSDVTLADGEAYFLGLIENDAGLAFNSITVSSFAEDFSFNVDDITVAAVPLPGALWLMGAGLFSLLTLARRNNSR